MTHREAIERLKDIIFFAEDTEALECGDEFWPPCIPALEMAIEKLYEDMPHECEGCERSESCEGCPHRY